MKAKNIIDIETGKELENNARPSETAKVTSSSGSSSKPFQDQKTICIPGLQIMPFSQSFMQWFSYQDQEHKESRSVDCMLQEIR